MPRHVIIACSASKLDRAAAAGHIYTGVLWSTWRKHKPNDGGLPRGWRCWALSGLHGLVPAWQQIEPYDHPLTEAGLVPLSATVADQWGRRDELYPRWQHWETPPAEPVPGEVVMIGGDIYQRLAIAAGLPVISRIDGRGGVRGGIGTLRVRVARFAENLHRAMNVSLEALEAWPGAGLPSLGLVMAPAPTRIELQRLVPGAA